MNQHDAGQNQHHAGALQRSHGLAEQVGETVLDFAAEVLRIDGHAFLKLVKGAEHAVMKSAQDRFRSFRPLRPKATRSESSEIFILASGRKPLPADPDQGADTGS